MNEWPVDLEPDDRPEAIPEKAKPSQGGVERARPIKARRFDSSRAFRGDAQSVDPSSLAGVGRAD